MKRGKAAACLCLADILILYLTRHIAGAADAYSDFVYPIFVGTLGRLCSLYPFSVAELVIGVTAGCVILWLLRCVKKFWKKAPERVEYVRNGGWNILLAAAIFFTLFTLTEGPNYYRTSFGEMTGMEQRGYTDEELKEVYVRLIDRANALVNSVERDEKGLMVVSGDVQRQAVEAMKDLGKEYPELSGYYPRPKKIFFSQILSLQDLTGIYTPFTVEANYNRDMVAYNQPFTMCHELSHLKGFMQEEEVNFIAFLAGEQAEDVQFQYSSALLGVIYCGNELYKRDREAYVELKEQLCAQVQADFQANSDYWDTYEGLISRFSQRVNDVYLKVNQQGQGVKSYDRVVDLIVRHMTGES